MELTYIYSLLSIAGLSGVVALEIVIFLSLERMHKRADSLFAAKDTAETKRLNAFELPKLKPVDTVDHSTPVHAVSVRRPTVAESKMRKLESAYPEIATMKTDDIINYLRPKDDN